MCTHGIFLPRPAFDGRVNALGNAGISLIDARVQDSALYQVEITAQTNQSGFIQLVRNLTLAVNGTYQKCLQNVFPT